MYLLLNTQIDIDINEFIVLCFESDPISSLKYSQLVIAMLLEIDRFNLIFESDDRCDRKFVPNNRLNQYFSKHLASSMLSKEYSGSECGFSLLEVLVGLLILAIGLLGLAAMQMVSLRQNADAYLRSQATLQAYDIIDRMRANRQHALGGRFVIDFEESPDAGLPAAVKLDLDDWKETLSNMLPGPGDGAIEMEQSSVVRVTIRWREAREEEAPWQEFTTQSEI